MNTALPRIVVPCCTKPGFGFSSRFFRFAACLALCALFLAAPCFAPSAQAADLYVLGGGGGGGGTQSANYSGGNIGGGGGGGGAGAYVGDTNPNGSGGDGGADSFSPVDGGTGGSGGVSGSVGNIGSSEFGSSTGVAGGAGGNGGTGSGTGAGNGAAGLAGANNTSGNEKGGNGGNGGTATSTLSGSYGTVLIQGGDGGNAAGGFTNLTNGGDGGNGGDASLAATTLNASSSLSVVSGIDGSKQYPSSIATVGTGGAASFTANTLIAPTINLVKNDGVLSFTVTNLGIGNTGTTMSLTDANSAWGVGDTASIGALLLTGTGNFTLNDGGNHVTVGQLNIDGGTLNAANWNNLVGGGISYTTNDILLSGGATVDLGAGQDKTLDRVLTGAGSLTKTGAGTLTLSGANTYTGMTEVKAGTLALSTGMISNALALHDGTTFNTGMQTNPFWDGVSGQTNLSRLDVHGSATYSGNLNTSNGVMNFYVPTTMGNDGIMLTVTGEANITGSTANVGIAGGSSPLQVGNQVVLIDASQTGLIGDPANTTSNGQGMQGVTLLYEFDILADSDKLFATVSSIGVNPQLKSLSEGRVAGMAFVNQGSDLMLGSGLGAMLAATQSAQGGFVPFAVGMGGSSRYDTGSHVDVDGFSLMTGLAWRQPVNEGKNGSFLAGAFFEAGWGGYTSHNSFDNAASVKGDGDISYYGGGLLGRYDFAPSAILGGSGNLYVDASFRAGHVSTDFSSSDLVDGAGRSADYDSGSAYYGAHAGLGYVWNITERASLDLSTRYIWTHQNSDTVNVLGDPVKFKASDSHRWRTGARFAYAINEYVAPYAGAYYDHEFDGKAKASTNGYAIDAPDLTGGTGVGELGFTLTPSQNLPLSFDLGVQGYTGVREGVTGSLQVKFEF